MSSRRLLSLTASIVLVGCAAALFAASDGDVGVPKGAPVATYVIRVTGTT